MVTAIGVKRMRLIDADALIAHLKKDPLFGLVEQYGISGVIEAQPTVDAVPVEWIKKQIKRSRHRLVDVDEDDKDLIWDLRTKIYVLSGIAEYWRKEHETD